MGDNVSPADRQGRSALGVSVCLSVTVRLHIGFGGRIGRFDLRAPRPTEGVGMGEEVRVEGQVAVVQY